MSDGVVVVVQHRHANLVVANMVERDREKKKERAKKKWKRDWK